MIRGRDQVVRVKLIHLREPHKNRFIYTGINLYTLYKMLQSMTGIGVRESAKYIYENAKDVTINVEQCRKAATDVCFFLLMK